MINRLQPRVFILSAVLAVVAAAPFFSAAPSRQGRYSVRVELATDTLSTAQLFYDLGHGITEEDSVRHVLRPTSKLEPIIFPIPSGMLARLRLDPINCVGKITLGEASVVDADGRVLLTLPPSQFYAAHDVVPDPDSGSQPGSHFTATSADPYFETKLTEPLSLPAESEFLYRIANALPAFFLVFIAVLFVTSAVVSSSAADGAESESNMASDEGTPSTKTAKWLLGAGILLALFKLWLVAGQTICAFVDAGHDDQLFINLANDILGGRWLGPYSQFTLMKGPMYSLFIAGVFILGIPLFTAQHLLYTAACGVLVRALRPFRINPWLLFGLFVVLLFNPVTYDSGDHTRVIRQQILPPLTLAIVAGGIGLYARRRMPVRKLVPWALLAGVSLPAFWMTREEGVWIAPILLLLWGTVAVAIGRERHGAWKTRALIISLPFLFWAAGMSTVCWLNYTYYGVFTTCEFKHPDFKAAYGSLLRIEPQIWRQFIPVPREVRERAYAVSPTFAILQPYLEGSIGEGWAKASEPYLHLPASEHEIGGGYFMWALRDAVAASGNATSGREAMLFYRKMAREINDACDRGLLKAGPPRSGFLPPWHPSYTHAFPGTVRWASLFFISFEQLETNSLRSDGSPQNYARFADLTRGRLTPPVGADPIPRRQRWLDGIRIGILAKVMAVYKHAALWAGGASMLAFFVALGVAVAQRRLPYFVIVSGALLGSCLSLVLICSLVEMVSFQAVCRMYFTGGYGLWLLFLCTSWLALLEVIQTKPLRTQ